MILFDSVHMVGLILFSCAILGFLINSRKNILLLIISLEISLLAISFMAITSSLFFDDSTAACFSLYILALAGSEAAIGLSLLVIFHKVTSSCLISSN